MLARRLEGAPSSNQTLSFVGISSTSTTPLSNSLKGYTHNNWQQHTTVPKLTKYSTWQRRRQQKLLHGSTMSIAVSQRNEFASNRIFRERKPRYFWRNSMMRINTKPLFVKSTKVNKMESQPLVRRVTGLDLYTICNAWFCDTNCFVVVVLVYE